MSAGVETIDHHELGRVVTLGVGVGSACGEVRVGMGFVGETESVPSFLAMARCAAD